MATQPSLLTLYESILRNFIYTFVYYPTTNWQRAFSPTFYFGCNVDDSDVEQHVLATVGSYGKQLNRVIDVLTVLVARADRATMTPQERQFVERFEDLAARADEAASAFQNEQPRGVVRADVDQLLAALRRLKDDDRMLYDDLVRRIRAELPPGAEDGAVRG